MTKFVAFIVYLTFIVKVKSFSNDNVYMKIETNGSFFTFHVALHGIGLNKSIYVPSINLWHEEESSLNKTFPWFLTTNKFDYNSPHTIYNKTMTQSDCMQLAAYGGKTQKTFNYFVWNTYSCVLFENQKERFKTKCKEKDFCLTLVDESFLNKDHKIKYEFTYSLNEYNTYKLCATVSKDQKCVNLFYSTSFQYYNETIKKASTFTSQEQRYCYPINCYYLNANIEHVSENKVTLKWKNTRDATKYDILVSVNESEYKNLFIKNVFITVPERFYDYINSIPVDTRQDSKNVYEECFKICSEEESCHRFVIINNKCYKTFFYDLNNKIDCYFDPLCNKTARIISTTLRYIYTVKNNTKYKFILVGTYGNGEKVYSNELIFSTYSRKFETISNVNESNYILPDKSPKVLPTTTILLIVFIVTTSLLFVVTCYFIIIRITMRETNKKTNTNFELANPIEDQTNHIENNIDVVNFDENDYEIVSKRASEHTDFALEKKVTLHEKT